MINFRPLIVGLCAGCLTTGAFIPQAIKTFKTRDTSDLSVIMYVMFVAGIVLWMVYGFWISNFSIFLSNVITFLFSFPILVIAFKNFFENKKKK